MNCGSCTPPQTCGGGGTPNVCATPTYTHDDGVGDTWTDSTPLYTYTQAEAMAACNAFAAARPGFTQGCNVGTTTNPCDSATGWVITYSTTQIAGMWDYVGNAGTAYTGVCGGPYTWY
jgi:hypothetical protein